jgi:hypothetical protein
MYITAPSVLRRSTQLSGRDDPVRLRHFQRLVEEDSANPGKVKVGNIVPLEPKHMNPGFIDHSYAEPGRVNLDVSSKGLQPCLEDLLKTSFPHFLAKESLGKPSPCDRVRVALVNLTGPRWFDPDLAMWGGTYPMEAASVSKLLVVYALYQLRFDLRALAADKKIIDSAKLRATALDGWRELRPEDQPTLDELFDLRTWDGKPDSLQFSKRTQERLDAAISHNDNCAMGRLMGQIGFPFVASVASQSGLWEPLVRGGLWLSATFGGRSCTGVGRSWSRAVRAPGALFASNATALAVATFYTLLSQWRLIDRQSSLDIMLLLGGGCGLPRKKTIAVATAKKCGLLLPNRTRLGVYGCKDSQKAGVTHDSGLFHDKDLRYVLVVMSYVPVPGAVSGADYDKLVWNLETLVRSKAIHGNSC